MDAVILYVNCEDPKWQRDFKRRARGEFKANRFRDWGTLPFLFRGIAKYLPFIEKVHLVVARESQIPGWIDREKVHVVLHKDIIPEQYLPTFNSCVIETHIPYIEGLSEEFIYFNDDMFPMNPCTPELFFKEGRPQDCFPQKSIIYAMGKTYPRQCWNSTVWAREALGMEKELFYFSLKHWPHPMLRSYCQEILQIQADKYAKQVSALRTKDNVNQYLFTNYMYLGGVSDNVEIPFAYVTPKKQGVKEMCDAILNSPTKILCINDNGCKDEDYPRVRAAICEAFMQKFPERCKYERGFGGDLIISMTSYPARIGGVAKVWNTIMAQQTDTPFRCVLALAEPEFPGRKLPQDLQQLIDMGLIEIIWHPRNIRSHKKIIPVLKIYPDAEVIVVDDDILRPQGWLQSLIDDHKKHPDEIITNLLTSFYDGDGNWQRITGFKTKHAHGKNHIPGLVSQFIRFGSGSGTYFPAHTFTDKRFFDEDLMMRLSPSSDESWMYLFAMMSGITVRQTSKIYDESALNLPGTQNMPTALYKTNKLKYDEIWANFYREFPEFKKKIEAQRRKFVISLTSFPKRYGTLPKVFDSLLGQTIKPAKIVLCLAKGDERSLTEEVLQYIRRGLVELLICDEDLRPHNKYFWTMRKYQDYAVITVDDDMLYAPTMAETLLRGYWFHPDCVIARRVHRIIRENGVALPYKQWEIKCKSVTEPSSELLATGVGGVLYPPNILGLTEQNLPKIKESLTADDLYLKWVEDHRDIKVLYVKDKKDYCIGSQEIALYKKNVFNGGNDSVIRQLSL